MNAMWLRQSPRGSFLKYSSIEEHQCSFEYTIDKRAIQITLRFIEDWIELTQNIMQK
jgi:hypothetical protein